MCYSCETRNDHAKRSSASSPYPRSLGWYGMMFFLLLWSNCVVFILKAPLLHPLLLFMYSLRHPLERHHSIAKSRTLLDSLLHVRNKWRTKQNMIVMENVPEDQGLKHDIGEEHQWQGCSTRQYWQHGRQSRKNGRKQTTKRHAWKRCPEVQW